MIFFVLIKNLSETDESLKLLLFFFFVAKNSGEAERIRGCKGRVLALKNEPHIQRVWLPNEDLPGLAMSRAFGDFLLKDYGIIAVPDVTSHPITSNDQFVVLATDGVS